MILAFARSGSGQHEVWCGRDSLAKSFMNMSGFRDVAIYLFEFVGGCFIMKLYEVIMF